MRFTHQPGAQPLAGYTIHRGIHRGGFGEVYYAHSDGGKEVALKLLQREQDVELRGVRQCLNLKHPNLVNLFDVRTDAHGAQWVVMEYVNGTSLEDVLASFPNGLPLDEILEWLSGIVAGVSYLHDRGIVHRDLKPANVYRENGTVKVGDVGLSKRLGSDHRGAHTQSVGTVYYMAPEVAHGQYGPEVDVYSLGIMLYEMLTGHLPFMGETTAEVLMKHLTATVNLAGIPEQLRPVIRHALAKDPRHRTQSLVQLNDEYQSALRLMGPALTGQSPAGTVNGTAARSWMPMAETPMTGGRSLETVHAFPPVLPPVSPSPARAASADAQTPPRSEPRQPGASSPPPKPTPAAAPRNPAEPAQPGWNWPVLVSIVVALILFAPGSWRSWTGIGLIAAACGATALLRGRNGQRMSPYTAAIDEGVELRSPSGPASDHLRGDLAAALTVGSVSASLCGAGTVLATEFFQRTPQPPPMEFLALFTATSIAATWLVLLAGHLRRKFSWLERNPRKTFLMIGILVGAVAFGLDQYLLVNYPKPGNYAPAFQTLGNHRLVEWDMNPTCLGYTVFFGGLMFWYRWWQEMSPRRYRQLSFGRLGTAGIAAWLMTLVFAFPQTPAVLWAISISTAVQLAAPWSFPVRRPYMGRS